MVSELTGLEGGLEVGQKINEIIRAKADVNSSTTGNAGTATKLQNARTISLTGDITGSTTFDGSANKSITTTLGNTTKIDGQWVSKTETLSTATAVGTYTIDLSSYLPNDNYNYEVFVGFDQSSSASSASYIKIMDFSCISTGSNVQRKAFYYIYCVTSNRTISFERTQAKASSFNLYSFGYRRIGTNT